jgi:D-galactarolactone cycloisomerase
MLIKDIRVHMREAALAAENQYAYAQAWTRHRRAIFCEIQTDTGLVGWGEAYPGFGVAIRDFIEHVYRPILLGQDPRDTEVLWDRCYQRVRDQGRKGVAMVALSAIDIALWDLRGKAAREPVWRQLGGRYRERVPTYATGLFHFPGADPMLILQKRASELVKRGFRAIKLACGFGLGRDIERVRAVRDAIGRDIRLMIDANQAYTATEAIQLANRIAQYNIAWLEEPVPPEDLAGYRRVRAAVPIPIAGGEVEYTHYGIRDLIAADAVDILQPDITITGGFTAYRRILVLAQAHNVAVCPHGWVSAVGLLANVQLCAVIPPLPPRLFEDGPILELDETVNPFGRSLLGATFRMEGDVITVPEEPGLGEGIRLSGVAADEG